jgi:eukaryotic-like serine/threonine-protein kinase
LLCVSGQWFFTMELIEGVDFITYVRGPRGPSAADLEATLSGTPGGDAETGAWRLAAPEVVESAPGAAVGYDRLRELLRQLADALDALHRRGTLHRDLKPSNVMIRGDGALVVLDFGLSTQLAAPESGPFASDPPSDGSSGSTVASTGRRLAGTAAYMSPEQCIGLPLAEVSDWYAVGVMLFLALTGKLPFTGAPLEIADQKRLSDPPDPRDLAPETPDDLREICLGLLAREARDRWSGDEVRRRLGDPPRPQAETEPEWLASSIPFVGRGEQLAVLQRAYREMDEGATVFVHVSGPSGVGKSRLVSQFLRGSPPAHSAVILSGRCFESESVPFKGLDTIIDALCRFLRTLPDSRTAALLPPGVDALARMFPVLLRVESIAAAAAAAHIVPDAQQLRRRAFAALREMLSRLGRQLPVVIAIDDLQWGDVDSAAVLAELLRPPGAPRLLLIAVSRSEHRGESACLDLLATIGRGPHEEALRRDVSLGPLSPDESRQMAIRLLRETDLEAQSVDAIARQAQGSPYFILEMAVHARSGHEFSGAAGTAPLDLDAALQVRLVRLREPARRLLEAVSVAGQPLALGAALEAAELTQADATEAAPLRHQHLLRTDGPGLDDPVSVYHDRIRESVVGHLPASALATYHGRLAVVLERSPRADAEQIARHFDAAGEPAPAARHYAAAADEAAGKLAFDRAARLYQRLLELLPEEYANRPTLLTKSADALANAGRGLEAALRYEAAAEGAGGQEAFELRRRAAHQFCISGHVDRGRRALAELLAAVGMKLPRTPTRSLASLLANRSRLFLRGTSFELRGQDQIDRDALHRIDVVWTASVGLSMFDVVAGAVFQTRGCLLALEAGEPFRLARALSWEAAHLSNLGGRTWDRNQRLLDEARRLAESVEDPYARHWATLCSGLIKFTNGKWKEARAELELAESRLRRECTGVAWELNTAHAFTLWSLFYLGELSEMNRRVAPLFAEAGERGDQYAAATHGAFSLPMSRLIGGDPEAAEAATADALAQWTQAGFHVQHFIALMCRTYIDLYSGRGEAAWRRMEEQLPLVARSQLLRVQVMRSLLTHLRGRAALAFAREAEAPGPLLRAARREAKRLLRERMPYCTPHARHLLAGVAVLWEDWKRADDLLEQAMRGYEQVDMQAFAAALRFRLGELRGAAGGAQLIEEAENFFREQGVKDVARFVNALAVSVRPKDRF